jgi:lysophospholipase L1-like esterase
VAQSLGAEVYNLSWSGKAVVASQYDGNPSHMLPIIYDQLVPNTPNHPYDFKVPMDVVIIGAGANDFIGTAGSGAIADPEKFMQVYADWLVRIRGHYPKALIVAAMGANAKQNDRTLMIQYLNTAVQRAQTTLGGSDPNIIFFDYFANDPNGWTTYGDAADKGGYNWGCNYHPSIAGSGWLAERLTPVVKTHMGW